MLLDLFFLLLCYIIGAIPTGLIVGRLFARIDVREYGSKNIGATNVWRVLGWRLGLLTFLTDVAKAAVGVLFIKAIPPCAIPNLEVFAGVAILLGNFFSVFLKFRGGKGVATSLGVFLALAPYAILIAFGIFLVVFGISRYVSLGSIAASIATPILTWYFGGSRPLVIMVIVIAAVVIFKHRANIQRLLNGTENKFKSSKTASS